MKMLQRNKLIITSLIALVGVSLASSITSTIAWFQYATRATVAYTGTTAHCSKLLKISSDDGAHWGNSITSANLPDDVKYSPITTGEMLKNAPLPTQTVVTEYEEDGITPKTTVTKPRFYDSPDYRQGLYNNWLIAEDDHYLQFSVLVKLADVDENYGTADQRYLKNDVFLTDLTIQNAGGNDLANAVRVHFATDYYDDLGTLQHKYFLFAKDATETAVGGFLDVDSDGKLDAEGYEEFETGYCLYGGTDGAPDITYTKDAQNKIIDGVVNNPLLQTSYLSTDSNVIATDSKGVISGGISLGNTTGGNSAVVDAAKNYMKITVTIWLEGWSELEHGVDDNYTDSDSSIWDSASYAAKSFNVGMTLAVQLHDNTNE